MAAEVASTLPSLTPEQQYQHLTTSHTFTLQLEFLSSLSSPAYLHSLTLAPSPTQPAPLSQTTFLRYLKHIYDTWSQPQYARYLLYPNGLQFCKWLVTSREFREMVGSSEWENATTERLAQHWATWRRENAKE